MKKTLLVLVALICLTAVSTEYSFAQQQDKKSTSLKSKFNNLGKDTKDVAGAVWDKTKEGADSVSTGTKRAVDSAVDGTKKAIGEAVDGTDNALKKLKKKLK